MAVETLGTVQMKSDGGPGVRVEVLVDDVRIRLVSGNELIGEWEREGVGVRVLNDGFLIRAEGEEFILRTEDDGAVAEELGVVASTPRMARKVAASHPPEDRLAEMEEVDTTKSNLPAIAYALAGVLVLAGGVFLNTESSVTISSLADGRRFWLAFVVGGALMVGVGYLLAIDLRGARAAAVVVLLGVIVMFGLSAQQAVVDANHLLAYGFIAGGIVVGVAVVFSGSLRGDDDSG